MAQNSREETQYITKKGFVEVNQPKAPSSIDTQKGSDVVLFSFGFDDETNLDFYNESTPPVDWFITTDVNISPVGGLNPHELPGADNGYAHINGDAQGTGSVQNSFIEYTQDIDLSDAPNVSFTFLQVTRNFATTYYVDFSIDGGDTWIPVQVNEDIIVNTNSANPEVETLNVSDIIGGQSQVRWRFNFVADWGWFWSVDDVQIIETPPFELALVDAWFDEYILVAQDENYVDVDYVPNLEYSEYRQNHVREFTLIADVANQGAEAVTGVTLIVTFQTPDGEEQFTSDPIASLASGETAVITIDNVNLAAFANGGTLGDYTVDFEVVINEDDALPENNVGDQKAFSVVTERMSNDGNEGYTGWYNIGQAAIWGNQFTVEEETTVNYIQFGFVDGTNGPTVVGEEVWLNLRQGSVLEDEGPDNVMNRFFGDDDVTYTIEEGDVSTDGLVSYITVMLPEEIDLQPGVVYQAELEVPEVGEDIAFCPVSNGQEGGAGVLYDFIDPSTGPQGWFTLGANTPNVRAGFQGPDNTGDQGSLDFFMGQNFPNPVNEGTTRISWNLMVPAENIVFTVTDNTGRVVYQKDLGDRPAGVQEDIVLDNLDFASGVYQYGLKIGNQQIVRKMVITK